ncbi:hypothetical protein ABEX25_15530 [Paenibacillus thiaminolyticus]|uniref:hypothetical protein n=1 Tax=Paenibacillus thiaminolyticus TaxID=49283 RepID=UPI003D296E12
MSIKGDVLLGGINQEIQGVTTQTRAHPDDFNPNVLKPLLDNDVTMSKQLEKIADAPAKILAPKAFKATDEGDGYPLGVSMFYLDADGMQSGWPFNNGQVLTIVTGKNRVSQLVFETNIATQRIWTRRWSSTQKAWSDFLQQETTTGSQQKADDVLAAAKQYTDDHNNAKILSPMAFTASDEGTVYPRGMSMFWLNGGKSDGWPADNGQIVTWHLAPNRLSQIFFEVDVRSLRMWIRRWSDNQKIWSDWLEMADKEYVDNQVNVLRANVDSNTDEIAKHRVAIDELKKSGVDAKNRIAGAISAKGVQASANDTWPTLETKIHQIPTGTGGFHTATIEFNIDSRQQGAEHTLTVWGPTPNIKKVKVIQYAATNLEASRLYSSGNGDFVKVYLRDSAGVRWELASSTLIGLKDVYILSWYITLDNSPGLTPKAYVKFLDGKSYKTASNTTNPPAGFNVERSIDFVATAYQQNNTSTVSGSLSGSLVYSW